MKFVIKHEIKGRIRAHAVQYRMTFEQADRMQYYLESQDMITSAKVQNRTGDFTICYKGDREKVIKLLQTFRYEEVDIPENYAQNSGRELNQEYWDKLVETVIYHYGNKLFLPYSVRACITAVKSVKYLWMGVRTLAKGKIEVPVLDATAIGVSMFRGDIATAGSVMFLLGIGEILEEWTHKKSVGDLARSMSLNISKVWLVSDGQEVLVPFSSVKSGDMVRIHMGNVIPFDGTVVEGEAMVNQASLTGESVAVRKIENGEVYAGTVVEEGELTIRVREANGSSKFEKIVTMIEESEKLKSGLESKAEHLADKLVPYTLAGTGLTYLLTRNVTKALAVLMVDFSCALKLAMPISVLSAIREASSYNVTVKGGKYLEAMAEADTIVFDKTGTLTKAQPTVVDVVPFCDKTPDELLRIGACLEEHFPHSMAKAVVNAAQDKGLIHEEFHSKVEYIVAHGISSKINDQKVVVGSYHFVFEDEESQIPEGMLREEAPQIIKNLKAAGISKVVMMTGDSDRTAKAIAKRVGVDVYYSEVLPEDKANFVEQEKAAGRKVIMIGDGINDSPALSAADIGIAISDGAEIAREIADVTMSGDDLSEIVTLKLISNKLMKRIHKNYRNIVGFNTALIILGVTGILQPTVSALLHNTSTLYISLKSMENLLEEENEVEEYI